MHRPPVSIGLLSLAVALAACDNGSDAAKSDEAKPESADEGGKSGRAGGDDGDGKHAGDGEGAGDDGKGAVANAGDDGGAAASKCKPDEVAALAKGLAELDPAARPLTVASELGKACELPPAFGAYWKLTLSPDGVPDAERKTLTDTTVAVLDEVCPKDKLARTATKALPPVERMRTWYEQCEFERFGLIGADEYLARRPSSLVPWYAKQWLGAQGVDDDAAKAIALAMLQSDPPTYAKPGQTLPRLTQPLPPVSDGYVVHLTARELFAADKAIVTVDEKGAFDSSAVEDHLVGPLFDVLAEEADRRKQAADTAGNTWDGRLILVADEGARFSSLVDVLWTAGRAEFRTFELVANAAGRNGAVPFDPPKISATPGGTKSSTDDAVAVFVLEDGFRFTVPGERGGAAAGKASNPFRPGILLANPRAPLDDFDRWDYAALAAKIETVHTLFPALTTLNVSAEEPIPLGAVLRTVETVRGKGCKPGGKCVLPKLIVSASPITPDTLDPGQAARDAAEDAGLAGSAPSDLGLVGTRGEDPSDTLIGIGDAGLGPGKKVSRVRQSKASVSGSLDKDIIRRIVRSHINEVRDCYNKGLAKDPKLAGKVTIDFTIGATGKVPGAKVGSTTLGDEAVGKCIAKALKGWKFPRPSDGGVVKVSYPFVLAPG